MSQDPPGHRPPPPPATPYAAPPAATPYSAPPPATPYGQQPGAPPPQYAHDPYAAERALAEWAQQRSLTLSQSPDLSWYQGWQPFVYVFPIARVGRELRGKLDDADIALVEAFDNDPIKQAASEDRQVLCFLMSPRLRARAALRAKSGGGLVNDVKSGFGSLFSGSSAGSVLGDPTLEQRFDVTVPSRDEGNAALPVALRQMLVQYQWRGILEVRAGGLVCAPFDRRQLDPAGLDQVLGMLGPIYRAAAG
jgi:hypothetical protein